MRRLAAGFAGGCPDAEFMGFLALALSREFLLFMDLFLSAPFGGTVLELFGKGSLMNGKCIRELIPPVLACILVYSAYAGAARVNQLSPEEKKQGFTLLFDGKSMDQWRNYKAEGVKPQWQIQDGALTLTEKGGRDLVTKEKFGYFDLRLEFNVSEKCNSGITFRVDEKTKERLPWYDAPEYQVYDSFNVKVRENRGAGALYGLIGAPKDLARKPGEWNQARILLEPADDGKERLRFWLNDDQTVDLVVDHAPDSGFSKLLKNARNPEHFGAGYFKSKTGHILLQDHGKRVAYRNIRIRRLATARAPEIQPPPDQDPKNSGLAPKKLRQGPRKKQPDPGPNTADLRIEES